MPFKDATQPVQIANGSGITAALRVTKACASVGVVLTAAAQELHFGGSLIGKSLVVQIGTGEDEGRLRVLVDKRGTFEARPFLKFGGVRLQIAAWPNLPRAPRAKGAVTAERQTDGSVLLTLPSWARPDGEGGKLDAAFGRAPAAVVQPKGVSSLAAAGKAKALGR